MRRILGVILVPSVAVAIGFDAPPYPEYDNMPHPYRWSPPTPCAVPHGTFRLNAINLAQKRNIDLNKLVLKIHVNPGGMLTLTLQLKPDGREEFYVVSPYSSSADLARVCVGNQLNFYFSNINLYGKKLSGEISANFIRSSRADYLKIDGYVERYDRVWDSSVRLNLNSQRMDFAYPYTE